MNRQDIRKLEKQSIRQFMEENNNFMTGDVLDYGCGDSPYKDLTLGTYYGFDKGGEIPDLKFNCIICNQVIEYVDNPLNFLYQLYNLLSSGGHLIITYPTHWEEVENDDYFRFTKIGMEKLLLSCGFEIIKHELRCKLSFEDFDLNIGYGCVARKN